MLKIAILHCSPTIVKTTFEIIKLTNAEIMLITNLDNELDFFVRHNDVNIALIEVNFLVNNYDGIFIAKRLKTFHREILIIFIIKSITENNIKQIIDAEPFGCVYCEKIKEELPSVIKKAKMIIEKDNMMFVYYKMKTRYNISLRDVIYFESRHRTIQFICVNGDTDEFYNKMDNLESTIKKITESYIRINQSCLVNIKYIVSVENNSIKLINGETLNIGRKYYISLNVIKEQIMRNNLV